MTTPGLTTVVVGTHRPNSNALRVARYYLAQLHARGVEAALLELEQLPHDFLFSDYFGRRSAAFAPFEQQMWASAQYVFVVPEYNGSFPGVLKAFIDAMKPNEVFHGKRAALIGEATGRFGNVRGLDHLVGVLNYVRVDVMAFRAHLMRIDQMLDAQGQVTDPAAAKELEQHLQQFMRFAALAAPQPA